MSRVVLAMVSLYARVVAFLIFRFLIWISRAYFSLASKTSGRSCPNLPAIFLA